MMLATNSSGAYSRSVTGQGTRTCPRSLARTVYGTARLLSSSSSQSRPTKRLRLENVLRGLNTS